jgi:hypothetical protein
LVKVTCTATFHAKTRDVARATASRAPERRHALPPPHRRTRMLRRACDPRSEHRNPRDAPPHHVEFPHSPPAAHPARPPVRPRPPPAHARLPRPAPYLRCNGLGILATKAWNHAPSPYCLFKGPPPLLAGSAPPPRHHGRCRRAFHPAHFQYRANPLGASPPSPRPTHATSCPGRAIFVAGAEPPRPPNRSAAARPRQ